MFRRNAVTMFCLCIVAGVTQLHGAAALQLQSNDVVAFVGGSDVAAAQFNGHLEAVLTTKFSGVRFRNLGWEGDTVFAQPRDVGFPSLAENLKRAGVTVLFLQFGRGEALNGREPVRQFSAAYEKLALDCAKIAPRIVLVTPAPFEGSSPPLPDLSAHNDLLSEYAKTIRALGVQHDWPVVDVFARLTRTRDTSRITSDGWQFSPRGHVLVAEAFVSASGIGELAARDQDVAADGTFVTNKEFETLRQLVIEKNKLWFNYWRPQNWAFLGGDRVSQPSSHDHRDPKVRWMPAEMEKYPPLIREKEEEIQRAATALRGDRR